MKKLTFLLLALTLNLLRAQVNVTWDGGGTTNNFSDADNWSTNVVPTTTNSIIFDGTNSKNCDFDINVSVISMSINSGYLGTVNGLNSLISFTGSYSQSAGTFNSTTDSLRINDGNLSILGGTFNHNNGIVVLRVSQSFSANISGTVSFNKLMISARSPIGSTLRTVNYGTATTTSTLILHTALERFLYQGAIGVTSLLDLRGGVASSGVHTATFTLGGAGNFTMTTTATNVGASILPHLIFNTSGNINLTGVSGGFFSVRGNWTHVAGTFVPGTSTVYFFGNPIIGSGNAFCNVTAVSNATLNFPSNNEVKISGNLTFLTGASANFATGSVLGFNGNGIQYIQWYGQPTLSFGSIRVYNTVAGHRVETFSYSGSGLAIIQDSLKVDGGLTTQFRTNGRVTLRSTAALKGRIATLGTGASVTGSVTVQTLIPGGLTGWANLGVAGVSGQTVKSWDTYSTSGGANGIPMTCSGCSYNENSVSYGPFTSIQGWTETTATYNNLIGTTPLTPGTGFWVYVGDGYVNTNALTLVTTGSLVQGNVSVGVTRTGSTAGISGFNLVSNPYACPIGWSKVFAASTNVNNAIYIYSADLGATAFVGGVSDTPGGANNIIPAGQGFYVEASAAGSVNFTEACKMDANTSANPLLKTSQSSASNDMFRLKLQGSNALDFNYTAFRVHPQASPYFDQNWDARKVFQSPGYVGYPGPYTKYTTISTKDQWMQDYSIQSISSITGTLGVPVLVKVMASGNYTISAQDFENYPGCMFLRDKLTNAYVNLKISDYAFSINDTTSAPRFELVLCEFGNSVPLELEELSKDNLVKIYNDGNGAIVETNFDSETELTISAYNLLGQAIMKDQQVSAAKTKIVLPINAKHEVVLIRVNSPSKSYVKKIVVQ